MKVKEFVRLYNSANTCNVELYELNEGTELHIDIETLYANDGLHEEWKKCYN